jgi:hypothetical protein
LSVFLKNHILVAAHMVYILFFAMLMTISVMKIRGYVNGHLAFTPKRFAKALFSVKGRKSKFINDHV